MKIVKIYGGLGNQMFQYAFSRALAVACGEEPFLDPSSAGLDDVHNGYELERVFGIEARLAPEPEVRRLADRPNSFFRRIRRKYFTKGSQVIDKKFGYQPELLSLAGDFYYEGYWQSEKYFVAIEDEIRRAFAFAARLDERNESLLGSLRRPVASVHVRRGDYLKYPNLDICTPGYYRRAIAAAREDGSAASFLVLSDDIGYCREALGLDDSEAAFVDWNRGDRSWQDMAIMARCDAHIIANSSFSWWGAWLDPKPGARVIAPAVWNRREIDYRDNYYSFSFGDIVPATWRRLPIS
jgi:hypothetical protein